MRRWILALAGSGVVWTAALAADPAPDAGASEPESTSSDGNDDDDEERVTGKKPPALPSTPVPELDPDWEKQREGMTKQDYIDQPYDNVSYIGAAALDMHPEFVHLIRQGLELLYERNYNGARDYFEGLEKRYPNTGVAGVVDTLIWQALMLENFDYKYDKQYWVSTKRARADLDTALEVEGNEAWEHFLYGGVLGIEAIHTMRKSQYLQALQLAFSAMDHIQKSSELAPDFTDQKLADGMYHYWRTVVTMNSKVLPDFGDHRVQGLEEMQEVEARGVFLAAPATLSLAFSWIEEGNYKLANVACIKNRRRYPDNIVNNLVTGSVFIYQKKYTSALGVYDEILQDDPTNRRVHYWRGLALMRSGHPEQAKAAFETYLNSEYLESYQKSYTHYRLGQVAARQKDWPTAVAQYTASVKEDGHKGAKKALDRLKQDKKAGKIDY
ncbi:MAG: tetratricopeptide (TPR) repeat protein [Myxococcota bacterium]|jgi:tetratricopeptide (TPR) repeat protein